MITIGIELNHVVRNINRQILKYYNKEFHKEWDVEDMDDERDVYEYIHFDSKKDNYKFFFEDYPFEIFGSAETMERSLAVKINNWLVDISDIEDEDIRIVFYSMNEDNIALQSSYFFLSKIGARVRKMFFPKNIQEVLNECDVVITANKDFLENETPQGKKVVLINKPFNSEVKEKAYKNYNTLSEVIEDNNFLKDLMNEERN